MPVTRRMRSTTCALLLVAAALAAIAPAALSSTSGKVSHASLWQALGGKVRCGLALTTKPPSKLLCEGSAVPAPKKSNAMEGDAGFVFLGARRRPSVARLSQNTWVGAETSPLRQVFVRLGTGRRWSSSSLHISCSIGRSAVTCRNRTGNGFTLSRGSYRAF
jgi:hypothetical protein